MKSRWLMLLVAIMLTVAWGCRNGQKRGCSTCGAVAPTTTYAPPTHAPVFDNQFVSPPGQTFDPAGVQLDTVPIQGGGMIQGSGGR